MNAKDIIAALSMQPHPEGGYYAETYRSPDFIDNSSGEKRHISTAIYFLLENKDKSHFHRIQSDELWFFHQGATLEIISIQNEDIQTIVLGNDIGNNEVPQAMIPAGCWFGSRIKNGEGYSLVSCTVAPGFDFDDFELADREVLTKAYPHLKDIIQELSR